jgi:alpha-L-fucosidase
MDTWFESARFGLFVHWGAYSTRGWEPSWPMVGGSAAFPFGQDVPVDEYRACFPAFAPPPDAPRVWAQHARRAGMRYAVLTTKHHDGFTLFPTRHSPVGVHHTLPGRDLVREFVDAFRAEGLRIGLYFSLSDWSHPDYPAFTDEMRPYPFLAYPRPEPEQWHRFVTDQRAQLTQLLSDYGTIDVLWFDGGWERSADEWGTPALEALIYGLQPDIHLNDRLPGAAGYTTPEQVLPSTPPDGPWETCLTMNRSWGNVASDPLRKPVSELLTMLTEVAAGGGNLLLNVSPDAGGVIPSWQIERLDALGAWLERHGEAVFDTRPGLAPWQFHGPTTRGDGSLYLFCPYRPVDAVVVRGVPTRRVESIRAVGTGTELAHRERVSAIDEVFNHDPLGDLVIEVPAGAVDPLCTVIEVRSSPTAR